MTHGFEYFADLGDWTDDDVQRAGYKRRSVSIFDHWLSEEEATSNPFFHIEDAMKAGLLQEYLEREKRFLCFYRIVFAQGAYRRSGLGRRRRLGVVFHSRWDRRLKKAVQLSLRDRIHIDAYSPQFSLRLVGNWDRSDVLLFTRDNQTELESIARGCGLFII